MKRVTPVTLGERCGRAEHLISSQFPSNSTPASCQRPKWVFVGTGEDAATAWSAGPSDIHEPGDQY